MPTFSQPTSLLDTIKKETIVAFLLWYFPGGVVVLAPRMATSQGRLDLPPRPDRQRPDTRSAQTRPSKHQHTRSTTASVAQACWASFFRRSIIQACGRRALAGLVLQPANFTRGVAPGHTPPTNVCGSKIDRSSLSDPALYPRFLDRQLPRSLPPAKTDHGTYAARADVCPETACNTLPIQYGSPSTRAWRPRWLNQPVVPGAVQAVRQPGDSSR